MDDDRPKSVKCGQILMCMGPYCNAGNRAERNADILRPLLDEINGGELPLRFTLDFSGCMNMCGAGPNWIILPDETVFHHVNDEAEINRIVDAHLRD